MNKKSQISFEMLMVMIIVSLIFVASYVVVHNQYLENKQLSGNVLAKKICDQFCNNINNAWLKGKGMKVNITMPLRINNIPYIMNISSDVVSLDWNQKSFICTTITSDINQLVNLPKAITKIENKGDLIEVS